MMMMMMTHSLIKRERGKNEMIMKMSGVTIDAAAGDRRRIFNVWKWNEYMEHNYQINSMAFRWEVVVGGGMSVLCGWCAVTKCICSCYSLVNIPSKYAPRMWSEIHIITFRLHDLYRAHRVLEHFYSTCSHHSHSKRQCEFQCFVHLFIYSRALTFFFCSLAA